MSTAAVVAGDRAHGGDTSLASERDRLRLNLLTANAEIWTRGPSDVSTSLDSSLKRNSTFIKRVRQGNIGDGKDALLRDVDALNLGKYLDELVPSLPELLLRSTTVKDRLAAIELISALHRRYGTEAFTVPLSEGVAAQLIPPNQAALQELSTEQRERDEAARTARQRVLVRGATELALTGLAGAGVQELGVEPVAAMGHDWLYTTLRTLVRFQTNAVGDRPRPCQCRHPRPCAQVVQYPPSCACAAARGWRKLRGRERRADVAGIALGQGPVPQAV